MAGLDLPGSVVPPDRSTDFVRILVAVAFTAGGIGGIVFLMVRRPPLTAA